MATKLTAIGTMHTEPRTISGTVNTAEVGRLARWFR